MSTPVGSVSAHARTAVRLALAQAIGLTALFFAASDAIAGSTPPTEERWCVNEGVKDAYGFYGNSEALYLPGIGTDFRIETDGEFIEYADGTAALSFLGTSLSDPNKRFQVTASFSSRVNPGDASYPPSGSPKKQLKPEAYLENGGPVDSDTWHYYEVFSGTITGEGDYAGGSLTFVRIGPSFQVGFGANGVNITNGASGWMWCTTVTEPAGYDWPDSLQGDINIDLRECERCVVEAEADGSSTFNAGAALWMPLIGTDFVFNTPGNFKEFVNGTASITGIVFSESNPNKCFALNLTLSGLVKPGDANYPPPMSPKKELHPQFYIENGGPIDPSTWHYYTDVTGQLTGLCCLAGATIDVGQVGPALQVGVGASGANLEFGASSWLTFHIVTQPTDPSCGPLFDHDGDINFDLGLECEKEDNVLTSQYGPECHGTASNSPAPKLAITGNLNLGGTGALEITGAPANGFALLLYGAQKANLPVLSGGCSLLVNPILGVFSPVGIAADGSASLPFNLPQMILPAELNLQCFAPELNGICASRGLEVRFLP